MLALVCDAPQRVAARRSTNGLASREAPTLSALRGLPDTLFTNIGINRKRRAFQEAEGGISP